MTKRIAIQKNQIGLIVRGMLNPDHNPSVFAQHADCILPDGSPIGFFGEGPGAASRGSGSSMSIGLGMAGVVFDYVRMKDARFAYVNPVRAKQEGLYSTVLILDTTEEAAERFAEYWRTKKLEPGGFSMLGNNCSTNASDGFQAAAIVTTGIPGLDTPARLFRQLRDASSKSAVYSGFVGFDKRADKLSGYDLVIYE